MEAFLMLSKKIIMLIMIILIVGIAGIGAIMLYNYSVPDKTYNGNGFNFTYPEDMKPNATFMYVISPQNENVTTLGNNKIVISISDVQTLGNESLKSLIPLDEFKELIWNSIGDDKSGKSTSLSKRDISKNGTTIYEEIYSSEDPIKNIEYKNKWIIIIKDVNKIINIIFQTKASDFESQQKIINKIIESITVT